MKPYFQSTHPVTEEMFFDRKKEVKSIVRCIQSYQSTAIVGHSKSGKTSLLYFLKNQENRHLYGECRERLVFQFLDAQMFEESFSQANFWENALDALVLYHQVNHSNQAVLSAYNDCKNNGFSSFLIERLFANIQASGKQLVLFIDEFDVLLEHPLLNRNEFFGSLRSIASRYNKALTLVIATQLPLSLLHEKSIGLTRMGSPYFNFFNEKFLPPFSAKDADEFLICSGCDFLPFERRFLYEISGGHPSLLQAGGQALLIVKEEEMSIPDGFEFAGNEVFQNAHSSLSRDWHFLSAETQKVISIVAINEAPVLLGEHRFDINKLTTSLSDYPAELRFLENQGYIAKNDVGQSGWEIKGKVILWFIIEETLKSVRIRNDLGNYFIKEEWRGLLKTGEQEQMITAMNKLSTMLKGGINVFVKALVESSIKSNH